MQHDLPLALVRTLQSRYNDILKAVDRLAWYYTSLGITPKVAPGEIPPTRTIAVFVTSSIDETLLELALAKMGLTALLLSVNNSVPAVAHLSKITNATHLIYSPKFTEEAKEAQLLLKNQGIDIGIIQDMRFPLWGPQGAANATKHFPPVLTPEQEVSRPAIYLHSSGSVRILLLMSELFDSKSCGRLASLSLCVLAITV